jgi:hypothetical protein
MIPHLGGWAESSETRTYLAVRQFGVNPSLTNGLELPVI